MVFGWRRKRNGRSKNKNKNKNQQELQLTIPREFLCPISLDLMKDPVTLSSGITYDRQSIDSWLENGNFTCPVTNQILLNFDQIPNHSLRKAIQDWCVRNQSYGVERIPTPRVPISSVQVLDLLFDLDSSAKCLNKSECLSLLHTIRKWSQESDRNRNCILSNPSANVLASVFDSFSSNSVGENADVLEEILCLMNSMNMFPSMDLEAQILLGSRNSLNSMVWFLETRDFSSKHNAILALKHLLSYDEVHADSLAAIEGVNNVLFKLIKDPISPAITKASLSVIFHLISSSSNQKIKSEFIEMGLVNLMLETIIDSDRSICERGLGVLDKVYDIAEGREEAYKNGLTWPVLVKKLLRVSPLATDYSVSSIWKLIRHGKEDRAQEILEFGAFQKLVLLLQVGCGDDTKEKATELLKMMNPYRRNGVECIESLDFKNLKRSFE